MIRLIVAGLAATRLVRAYMFEEIGEPVSERVEKYLDTPVIRNRQIDMRAMSIKGWAKDLVTCPHCLGFWATFAFVIGYRFRPARAVIEALAGAMILSAIVDLYPDFELEPDEYVKPG